MTLLGELALWIAVVMAGWCLLVTIVGAQLDRRDLLESGERAMLATCVLLLLALSGLVDALVRSDFSVRYVTSVTAANLPAGFKLTALWAGPSGALLCCAAALAVAGAACVAFERARGRAARWRATAIIAAYVLMVACISAAWANPFARLPWPAGEGGGLDPRLQRPLEALQAPFALAAFAAAAVAVAQTFSALSGREERSGLASLTWLRVAWLCLTLALSAAIWSVRGVSVGGVTSVEWVLPWAAALAWVGTTAAIHLLTRRATQPLHWPGAAAVLLATIATVPAVFAALIGAERYAPVSPTTRAVIGLFTAAVLISIALVVVRGAGVRREPAAAGSALVRQSAIIAHIGVVLVILGLAGSAWRKSADILVVPDHGTEVLDAFGRRWSLRSAGLSSYDAGNREVTPVAIEASRGSGAPALLTSELRQYVDSKGTPMSAPVSEPGIYRTPLQDLTIAVRRVQRGEAAAVHVSFIPLAWSARLGALVLILGATMAMVVGPSATVGLRIPQPSVPNDSPARTAS
jgi:cytochrome c biogenesis factor